MRPANLLHSPHKILAMLLAASLSTLTFSSDVAAQVRVKPQDRGVYQPPQQPTPGTQRRGSSAAEHEPLVQAAVSSPVGSPVNSQEIDQVGYEMVDEPFFYESQGAPPWHGPTACDAYLGDCQCGSCQGGVAMGCDGLGCDGCGACAPRYPWFASAELLLWWRRPQPLPALVTTSPANTNRDLAGQLDQAATSVLFGRDSYGETVAAGGRFTLGRWLDPSHCHSLTGRFWLTGSENYGFDTNSTATPIIARPFLNFTTSATGVPDAQLIAFPGEFDGNISVNGTSDVYGADVSIGQLCHQGFAGRLDFLYGYQFLRIEEALSIRSDTMVIGGNALPIGAMISVRDQFDVENEFHGAHFGFSGFYEEGCWTLDALAKFGFGSLTRSVDLQGETITANGGQTAEDPNGLLVRSSNAGTHSDNTFAWVPEFNVNLGYRWRPGVDLSVGYSVIGLTEAIQPWRTIDANLAADLSDNPTRPTRNLNYGDYWVQGINFGIRWCY